MAKRKPTTAMRVAHHGVLMSPRQARRIAEGIGETAPNEIEQRTEADRKAVETRRRIEDMRIAKELGLDD